MVSFGQRALHSWVDVVNKRTGGRQPKLATPNETVAGIVAHQSVRRFEKRTVSRELLELLVLAAQSAPTSANLQCWSVVVVTDPKLKAKFLVAGNNNTTIEQAPCYMVWLADLTHVATILGDDVEGLDHLETFLVSSIDAALAAQSFSIAAQSMGLGTVFHGSIRYKPEIAIEALSLPKHTFPVFAMAVGWPSKELVVHWNHPDEIKPRMPQHMVLHYNKYEPRKLSQLLDYDKVVDDFHRDNVISPEIYPALKPWRSSAVERFTLMLNRKLEAMIKTMGFGTL